MFGYIYVNQKDLSEESKKQYLAYYCGLCQVLKKSSGVKGQILLNYDMTFLIILLTDCMSCRIVRRCLSVRCTRGRRN